jgi:dihydrofolate reductase
MTTELTKHSIKLSLVVAMNNSNKGIGLDGTIPWRLPKDLKHFARVTTFTNDPNKMNAVIMGRLTWLSLPKQFRPLPNRLNVIISNVFQDARDCDAKENADLSKILIFKSFDEAIKSLIENYSQKIENIYSIGGARIFKKSLEYPADFLHRIYLTRVYSETKCDVHMEPDNFLDSFRKIDDIVDKENFSVEFNTIQKEPLNNLEYTFEIYEKIK